MAPGDPADSRDPVGRRAFVVDAGAGTEAAAGAGPSPAAEGAPLASVAPAGTLPDFHPLLKDELRFPLAWGTSPIRDFRTWRRAARAKVEEHLFVAHPCVQPVTDRLLRFPGQRRSEAGGGHVEGLPGRV